MQILKLEILWLFLRRWRQIKNIMNRNLYMQIAFEQEARALDTKLQNLCTGFVAYTFLHCTSQDKFLKRALYMFLFLILPHYMKFSRHVYFATLRCAYFATLRFRGFAKIFILKHFTAAFNNMRTLKFKAQPTNALNSLPSIKCSPTPPSFQLLPSTR